MGKGHNCTNYGGSDGCPACMEDLRADLQGSMATVAALQMALDGANLQVEGLRAEVERLKGEVKHISVLYGHHSTVAGALKAQEALRAEVTAYERRIPELCKDYIAKLDAANLQVDGLQKRLADSLKRPLPEDYRSMELQVQEERRKVFNPIDDVHCHEPEKNHCQVSRGDGLHCWLDRPCPVHEKGVEKPEGENK